MFPLASLPLELQDNIWEWSLPGTRELFLRRGTKGFWQWRASNQQTPTLLHVSWRARKICLQRYTTVQTSDNAPCTYIDYTSDSIFIYPPCPVLHWPKSFLPGSDCASGLHLERVRHLIVPAAVDWNIYPPHSFSILDFKNVCSLTFFVDIKNFNEDKAVLDNESTLATLCRLLGSTSPVGLAKWLKTHVTCMTWLEPPDICPPAWYSMVWASGEIVALKFERFNKI